MVRSLISRASLIRLIFSVLLIGGVAALGLRPDQNELERRAERARINGQWRAATLDYQQLYASGQRDPALLLRLATLRSLRGEWAQSSTLLHEALRNRPLRADADEIRLLEGWNQVQLGNEQGAAESWAALSVAAQGRGKILEAEIALRAGDLNRAASLLTAAGPLEDSWQFQRNYRAAQIVAAYSPSTTLDLLASLEPISRLAPIPPLAAAATDDLRTTLEQIAALEPGARRLSLARQWVAQGFAQAARATLADIDPASPYASLARDEDARLRWMEGDINGALADISQAVALYPNVAALRRTQALLATGAGDIQLANDALTAALRLEPGSPETHVASAALALALNDYDRASLAYNLAIESTANASAYQLQAAYFYSTMALRACSDGRRYAESAIGSDQDGAARTMAADLALRCGDPHAVMSLTAPLLEHSPLDSHLLYLRGAALWQIGEQATGRIALERVVDLAPGSQWMRSAEKLIGAP